MKKSCKNISAIVWLIERLFIPSSRKREQGALTFEESERRALLLKDWTRYKRRQHMAEMQQITKALESQQKALEALREESEELYQQAIQVSIFT